MNWFSLSVTGYPASNSQFSVKNQDYCLGVFPVIEKPFRLGITRESFPNFSINWHTHRLSRHNHLKGRIYIRASSQLQRLSPHCHQGSESLDSASLLLQFIHLSPWLPPHLPPELCKADFVFMPVPVPSVLVEPLLHSVWSLVIPKGMFLGGLELKVTMLQEFQQNTSKAL